MGLLNQEMNLTVESVLRGHPDKICDQISDAILDEYLSKDNEATVAVECMGSGNTIYIAGEVFSNAYVDIEKIVRKVYFDIGYKNKINVIQNINIQSSQLRKVVKDNCAGDQGIMYGYACKSKYNYLPYPIWLVNRLAKDIDLLREKTKAFLPDGKIQITFNMNQVEKLVINVQHDENTNLEFIKSLIMDNVIKNNNISIEKVKLFFNNKSNFIKGGFINDTGLTGRKIMCDTYCGLVPHGGGAFSGKDPSKVDRSGAYMSRYVAKNLVANGYCKECLVSVAYVFGEENPVMLEVLTDNPNNNKIIKSKVIEMFDFSPKAIIDKLSLNKFRYKPTATYGHFTNGMYPWEKIENF